MERKKHALTNEKISRKFNNQFDLVNYAIKLAENMIKSGRDPRVKIDSQNRALQVMAEISEDKDRFDELVAPIVDAVQAQGSTSSRGESSRKASRK
jgi:DNA-directed RNA polymerase subunit omega